MHQLHYVEYFALMIHHSEISSPMSVRCFLSHRNEVNHFVKTIINSHVKMCFFEYRVMSGPHSQTLCCSPTKSSSEPYQGCPELLAKQVSTQQVSTVELSFTRPYYCSEEEYAPYGPIGGSEVHTFLMIDLSL